MKKFLFSLCLFSTAVLAAPTIDGYTIIAGNDDPQVSYYLYGQNKSGHFARTRGGEAVYLLSIMEIDHGMVKHYQAYVNADSCKQGQGEVVYLDLNGNFGSRGQFVSNGPSIQDSLASTICSLASRTIQRMQKNNSDSI